MAQQNQVTKQLEADIGKGIDDAIDALRWARRHLHDRRASETLRLAQLNLTSLSLAIDWQMEGELEKATAAIERLWWKPHKDDSGPVDMTPTGH